MFTLEDTFAFNGFFCEAALAAQPAASGLAYDTFHSLWLDHCPAVTETFEAFHVSRLRLYLSIVALRAGL